MELRHLRYFLAVARRRNFTRAAEALHIAQPPLSQQIQQLERELGAVVFDRSARQVELTPAGRVLFERAAALLEQVDDLVTEVREVAGAQGGSVTLGVIPTAAALLVPQVARLMRKRMPAVELIIVEGGTSTIMEHAAQRRIDLGLLRLPLPTDEPAAALIEAQPLYQERVVVVLLKEHPLARRGAAVDVAELRDEPLMLVRRDQGTLHEQVMSACAAAGFTPRLVCEGAEITTLLRLVVAGVGVTIIPERGLDLLPGLAEQVVGLPLHTGPRQDALITQVGLIWRRGRYRSQAAEILAEIISDVVTSIHQEERVL